MHVAEAPPGLVQLRGGNAQIEEHPVYPYYAQILENVSQIGKISMDQSHPVLKFRQPLPGGLDSRQIPVHADKPARGQAAENLQGVSRPAQGAVQVNPLRPDGQGLQALLQQHGLVPVVLFHIIHVRIPTLP